jgi:hypothetical protein
MSAAKSRREVAGRLGLGAAAFVTSIVAPMPAQATSCLPHFSIFNPTSGGVPTVCCAPFHCLEAIIVFRCL